MYKISTIFLRIQCCCSERKHLCTYRYTGVSCVCVFNSQTGQLASLLMYS